MLKTLPETQATLTEARDRTTFVKVLLTERKFFVNLITSMLKKLINTARAFNGSEIAQAKSFPSF